MHVSAAASQLVHAGGLLQSSIVGSTCITSVLPAEVELYIPLPLCDVEEGRKQIKCKLKFHMQVMFAIVIKRILRESQVEY